jgi:hypothetical protein
LKIKYVTLITLLSILFVGCNKKISDKEWTKDQMDVFWQKFNPMLSKTLYIGKWRYQELGDHMTELATLCKERYGAYPVVVANYNSMPKSRAVAATSMLVSGKPQVVLFLPVLLDLELSYKQGNIPDEENQLNDMLVGIILHELEHLAYGYLAEERTFESSVNAESKTWAITCEKVLKPLVEHDAYLTDTAAEAYKKWLDCDRNANNPEWIKWISQTVANPK